MKSRLIKISLAIILSLFLTIILIIFFFFIYLGHKTNQPFLYFPVLIKNIIFSPNSNLNKTILILGLDRRNDWLEKSETTDTIIMTHFSTAKVTLISLPRDLWDYQISGKINQYYPQSKSQPNPTGYITNNIGRLTGQHLDHLLVIDTDDLVNLIDIIGGIDVNLEQELIDTQYPNPEYIANPNSKLPIYITISYPSGLNHLTKANIMPFIRSRKNADTAAAGGTDLGRIQRQQLVFDAIFNKLSNLKIISDRELLFNLYHYKNQNLETNLTDLDILSLGFSYLKSYQNLRISSLSLPVGQDTSEGVIYHPDKLISGQWVFLPTTPDYSGLKAYIFNNLK